MSVSISGDGSVTGIDQGLNVVGVVTATTLNVGTGTSISSPATNVLTLGTNNSERVRVDSSGRVGVGTDIPGSYDSGGRTLVISENSTLAGMTIRSSNQGAIYFADGLTGNEAYRGRIEYSHSADSLNFGTAGTGSKLTLTSAGAVQIANGNLVFSTAGTGIDFSAAGNASGMSSELFDDYEEGTWTPTLTNVGAGTPSYQYQEGHYTKIGRYVIAQGIMGITNSNTLGSGTIQITLPFTSGTTTYGQCGPVADGSGFTSFSQFGTMVSGTNSVVGYFVTVGAAAGAINYNQPSAAWYVRFNFMYHTAS